MRRCSSVEATVKLGEPKDPQKFSGLCFGSSSHGSEAGAAAGGMRLSWQLALLALFAAGGVLVWQRSLTNDVSSNALSAQEAGPCLGDQLEKLAQLHAGGALSSEEFRAAKAKLLGEGHSQAEHISATRPPTTSRPAAEDATRSPSQASPAPPAASLSLNQEAVRQLPRFPDHLHVHAAKGLYLPSNFQEVPLLPDEIWEASMADSIKDFPSVQALLLRLLRNETVRIQVYGGSMTFGEGCCTDCKMRLRECSWPGQLKARLEQVGGQVLLEHRARGGCDLECSLPEVVMTLSNSNQAIDLLLLDFGQNGMGRLTTLEEIVRVCHLFLPKTVVFIIWNRDMGGKSRSYRDKTLHTNYRAVAKHYSLPFFSYEHAMERGAELQADQTLMWASRATRHPPWPAHAFFADMLVFFCNQQLARLERKSADQLQALQSKEWQPELLKPKDLQLDREWIKPMQKVDLANVDVCLFPLSAHVARSPQPDSPLQSADGTWRLFEDRHDKPGWITTEEGGALSFNVSFSASPRLVVQYLRSYDNIGAAELQFHSAWLWIWKGLRNKGVRDRFEVQARWSDKISVTQNALFAAEKLANAGWTGGEREATISFRLTKGPKFKLISVISC
ncbi:unnamed protein product [Effrenium voratum]|nr:unnamed protein product [Effrenium voratum]